MARVSRISSRDDSADPQLRLVELHPDGTVTIATAANLLGITHMAVRGWIEQGLPVAVKGAPGPGNGARIRLSDVIEWRAQREAGQRLRALESEEDEDEQGRGRFDYEREKARRMSYQADLAEIEVRKATGELVPIVAVAEIVEQQFGEIRGGLLNLPARLAISLVGITDSGEIADLVRKEVGSVLTRLSSPEEVVDMALKGDDYLSRGDDELERELEEEAKKK